MRKKSMMMVSLEKSLASKTRVLTIKDHREPISVIRALFPMFIEIKFRLEKLQRILFTELKSMRDSRDQWLD